MVFDERISAAHAPASNRPGHAPHLRHGPDINEFFPWIERLLHIVACATVPRPAGPGPEIRQLGHRRQALVQQQVSHFLKRGVLGQSFTVSADWTVPEDAAAPIEGIDLTYYFTPDDGVADAIDRVPAEETP